MKSSRKGKGNKRQEKRAKRRELMTYVNIIS